MSSFEIRKVSNNFSANIGNSGYGAGNSYANNPSGGSFIVYGQDPGDQQLNNTIQISANAPKLAQAKIVKFNSNSGLAMFDSDEEAAKYLDEQLNLLCDDDDSNDAEAYKNINKCLSGLVCLKEVNGEQYIAYDTDRILSLAMKSDKDGLTYSLLSQLYNQINQKKQNGDVTPDMIIKLGLGGSLANTKLEVEKDGAGVRLKVTSNNNYFPINEIKDQPIVYAATDESARNYFMNGNEYDWEAIKEWFKANDDFNDNYHDTSIEYDTLSEIMRNMTDPDIETLLDHACYGDGTLYKEYVVSDRLSLLADAYQRQMDIRKALGSGGDFNEKDYAKAILIKNISDRMNVLSGAGGNLIPEIYYDESKKAYIATVYDYTTPDLARLNPLRTRNDQTIIVYETGSTDRVEQNLDDMVGGTIDKIAPSVNLREKSITFVFNQSASYVYGKAGLVGSLTDALNAEIKELEKEYQAYIQGEGAKTALNIGNALECMCVSGPAVNVSDDYNNISYIYKPEYDDRTLVFNVAAYNEANGTNYTIADMKREYINYTDEFKNYQKWYTDNGSKGYERIRDEMRDEIGGSKLDSMTVEEIEAYLVKKNK